jgi:hypothetical protein
MTIAGHFQMTIDTKPVTDKKRPEKKGFFCAPRSLQIINPAKIRP